MSSSKRIRYNSGKSAYMRGDQFCEDHSEDWKEGWQDAHKEDPHSGWRDTASHCPWYSDGQCSGNGDHCTPDNCAIEFWRILNK